MEGGKTHMDYAYELDLAVKPDSTVPMLGREYGAFSGAGVPLFSLGGGVFRWALFEVLTRLHALRGYYIAETPIIASSDLFKVSGHLDFYRRNMFLFEIEGHDYAIKPMNCPYHILLFMSQVARFRSKVPLPFKVFELGRVHRYEPSGSLYGLLRVRGFTQDDAHIITPAGDAMDTIVRVFEEMRMVLSDIFLLDLSQADIHLRVSLSDKSLIGTEFMGTREEWENAEEVLAKASEELARRYGTTYSLEEGEAAFYGPKIDVVVKLEEAGTVKEWQLGTIQFDFNLPRRFRLYDLVRETYGDMEVFIIHRALLGSIERFLGVYLEYSKGRLPIVLAPLQVAIIGIKTGGERDGEIEDKSELLARSLTSSGLRVGVKMTTKTSLSGDVRLIESTIKPPIVAYIGEREVSSNTVTLRVYDHSARRRVTRKVRLDQDAGEVLRVVEEAEEPVRSLIGTVPRIPLRLDHLL
ncbi:MAG: hypothetical protein GSR86_04185 [Desulfurococcales archaeon]|nr:hypothetical protein [Desulfurococcales archaeon]